MLYLSLKLSNLLTYYLILCFCRQNLDILSIKSMEMNRVENGNISEDIEIKHEPLEPDVENFVSHSYIMLIQV